MFGQVAPTIPYVQTAEEKAKLDALIKQEYASPAYQAQLQQAQQQTAQLYMKNFAIVGGCVALGSYLMWRLTHNIPLAVAGGIAGYYGSFLATILLVGAPRY